MEDELSVLEGNDELVRVADVGKDGVAGEKGESGQQREVGSITNNHLEENHADEPERQG